MIFRARNIASSHKLSSSSGDPFLMIIVSTPSCLSHITVRILCFVIIFKSNVRETWRVILVSEADIFLSESLRILAERLSQSEIGLPLRQICYYSPPEEVGVFSTEINNFRHRNFSFILLSIPIYFSHNNVNKY